MHDTAMAIGSTFFRVYGSPGCRILDVGSYDVNGTLRLVAPVASHYVGVDIQPGPGVNVVLTDPYKFPFDSRSFDLVVSTSCFEHDPMFWLTFLEMARVMRDDGAMYINAPSNGPYHGYPMDCWRFYSDAPVGLVEWARRNGQSISSVESFTGPLSRDGWIDSVMVFRRFGAEPKAKIQALI